MSARRLAVVPASPPAPALETVEAEFAAAQQAVTAAAAAVDAAKAALSDSLHDPAAKRVVLREELATAEERLDVAQKAIKPIHDRLFAAQRLADEAEAHSRAEHVGRAAQNRESEKDADEFINEVGGAIERFFVRISKRNLDFRDQADLLNATWSRLGHEHHIAGVEKEIGTGTTEIPPRVCLDSLHNWESRARQKLEYQRPDATPVQQAVRQFLQGAIDFSRTLNALKQTRAHVYRLENPASKGSTK